ncbi:MAG TPA: FxLYD domain-containing protein [Caulobacteraceae bacterium]|jgi:hypothetical protein|nr:FxLYD domain-containing protein [Caulobacteraceae bacterium]
MTELATPPAKRRGNFATGLVVGGVAGLVIGYALHESQGTASGVVAPPAGGASVASALVPAAPAAQALTVTLGRPRLSSDYVIFPAVFQNNSGQELGYVEADCAFYSKANTLLANAMTNSTNLPAGAQGSSQVMVEGATLDEIDHYQCRTNSN